MPQIPYSPPDHYRVDELLSNEHKIVRHAIRDWLNLKVKPTIEEYYEKAEFPIFMVKELGYLGAFGPFIPTEYGGAGLDHISYGLIMQELERGDLGIRSTASVKT